MKSVMRKREAFWVRFVPLHIAEPPFSRLRIWLCTSVLLGIWFPPFLIPYAYCQSDPLPSWNKGPAKRAITDFVKTTTTKGSPRFVPLADRIAEFDQDGTLWAQHPVYTQIVYCLDHVPALVQAKPELKDREPFKTVHSGDRVAIAKLSMRDFFDIATAPQSGMSTEKFALDVETWLATAKHPRWKRPDTDLVYQPMLEVLQYLRHNGYKTFIATGGSAGFVRVYSESIYGIVGLSISCWPCQPGQGAEGAETQHTRDNG